MKKINWNKVIKERNDQWEKADMTQKKIIIAKEVISMINTPVLSVKQQVYCDVNRNVHNSKSSWLDKIHGFFSKEDLQKGLIDGQISCTACARGSMMLAKFRFADPLAGAIIDQSQEKTAEALEEAFTEEELGQIESIFETNPHREDVNDYTRDNWNEDEILAYAERFSNDPTEKLQQIMERIILTKGDVEKALTCDPRKKTVAQLLKEQG